MFDVRVFADPEEHDICCENCNQQATHEIDNNIYLCNSCWFMMMFTDNISDSEIMKSYI